jgi:Fe-S-cluster-containing dehydrogenase component
MSQVAMIVDVEKCVYCNSCFLADKMNIRATLAADCGRATSARPPLDQYPAQGTRAVSYGRRRISPHHVQPVQASTMFVCGC